MAKQARCSSCGRAIQWVRHRDTERWMPVERGNHPKGRLLILDTTPLSYVIETDQLDLFAAEVTPIRRTYSHYALCRDAEAHRKTSVG